MSARRVYPAWLPPNPREREVLKLLRRRQGWVIGWLVALLPGGWVMLAATGSAALAAALTMFWIAVGVGLAQRVAESRCPRCRERFCARDQLPFWYGLFNQRCENCGLRLASGGDRDL